MRTPRSPISSGRPEGSRRGPRSRRAFGVADVAGNVAFVLSLVDRTATPNALRPFFEAPDKDVRSASFVPLRPFSLCNQSRCSSRKAEADPTPAARRLRAHRRAGIAGEGSPLGHCRCSPACNPLSVHRGALPTADRSGGVHPCQKLSKIARTYSNLDRHRRRSVAFDLGRASGPAPTR